MFVMNPLARPSWAHEVVQSVSRGWWLFLVTGTVSVVAGGIILLIDWTVSDLAVFLGVLLILRGLFGMMSFPSTAACAPGRFSPGSSR